MRSLRASFEPDSGEGPLRLSGFTITGGVAEYGGGLYVSLSSITLDDAVLTGNTATAGGGAAFSGFASEELSAGGFRRSADEGRVFVILPNGEAQPVSVSAWNYTPVAIPPGSTVVIPKEAAPLDVFAFIKDLTQITSQLAVSAAAIAAINRN